MLTFAACLVLGPSGTRAQQPLALHVLPAAFAQSFGAACLDGSPPAVYALVQDPARWVLFIEGGGWCFDTTEAGVVTNCAARAMGGAGSSKYSGPTLDVGGLLSSDPAVNPHYSNWSLVFIHYCDGTSHSSNATEPVPVPPATRTALESAARATSSSSRPSFRTTQAPSQLFFRGRANLVAVLSYLQTSLGMDQATDVVLSGGSAGATSVYLALDAVSALLPSHVRLVGAPDAGFFLDAVNVQTNTTWYRDSFQAADPVWNTTGSGGVNAACLAANPSPTSSWRCFLQEYAAVFITTPYIILNSAYDMWQILNDLSLGCVPSANGTAVAGVPACTAAQMTLFQAYRIQQLRAMAPALAIPHTGAFVDSCFVHEQNVDYCSTQPLPNCVGWNIFSVVPGPSQGRVTMDDTFFAWHHAVVTQWEPVMRARRAFQTKVVAEAVRQGEDVLAAARSTRVPHPSRNSVIDADEGVQVASVWDPASATVQVLDATTFPNNPSCPFPTPSPSRRD